MNKGIMVLGATLLAATAASAQPYPGNGSLGIYADAAGSSCCLQAPAGVPTLAYVLMTLGGETSTGISGAEFRIEISAPAGYFFIWNGNGALFNTILGSPIDDTPADPNDPKGVNMASANCQPSDHTPAAGDKVLMGTIQIINFGAGLPADLTVKRRSPPSNLVQADCPLVTLCDAPVFTKSCLAAQPSNLPLGTGEAKHFIATLNKACGGGSCGFVGVEHKTWSSMKALFW